MTDTSFARITATCIVSGLQNGVDRNEGSAGPRGGKTGHDGFRAFVEKNADALAAIQTEGHQAAGEAADLVVEFAITEGVATRSQRRRGRCAFCRRGDELMEKGCF